ncbi:hypothetical protein LCGC14_1227880 [marine sediment metagenome]|uniref:Uncharacterized protein n=1 Tax=marine sediment metagenome TaxID=412755 RepID=A0A0F9L9D0_9ZZZZ
MNINEFVKDKQKNAPYKIVGRSINGKCVAYYYNINRANDAFLRFICNGYKTELIAQ